MFGVTGLAAARNAHTQYSIYKLQGHAPWLTRHSCLFTMMMKGEVCVCVGRAQLEATREMLLMILARAAFDQSKSRLVRTSGATRVHT